MSGLIVLLVGLVLCFVGVGSAHLAVLAAGFALGWSMAGVFDADTGTALVVGLGAALVGWVVARLVFHMVAAAAGAIAGGVIGARVYLTFQPGHLSWVIGSVVTVVFAVGCGFVAGRYRNRVVLWLTAVGGAGVILSGLALLAPDLLGYLRRPEGAAAQIVTLVAWVLLAGAGWYVQRQVFPRILKIEQTDHAT